MKTLSKKLGGFLGAITLLASGPAWAEEWPTTDFDVVEVNEQLDDIPAIFLPLQQVLANWGVDYSFVEIELPDETREEIEGLFKESAELLEAWGFPPPALRAPWRSGGVYRVFIVKSLDISGRYHATNCPRLRDPMLFLNAEDILRDGQLTEAGRSVVAHELFHAVQFSMPFFDALCEGGSAGAWITEGTANALGWDLVRLLHGLEPPVPSWIWGARSYSRPLTVPLPLRDLSPAAARTTPNPYRTASFWRYLAELYWARRNGESDPGAKAATPFDYRYLLPLFGRPPPSRDCDEEGAPCLAELRWLDRRLQESFGAPLHDLYTRFIGTAALYGEIRLMGRAFGASNSSRWRRELFDEGCHPVNLTPQDAWHTGTLMLQITAAQCYEVSLAGFGRDVNVEVSVEGTENAWRVGDLSAIAARPEPGVSQLPPVSEPQRAEPRTDLTTNTQVVEWLFGLPDETNSYILITNVADDPAQSMGVADATINFIAKFEQVSLGVGGSQGDGSADDGPSPEEIDQPYPVEFELASGELSMFHEAPSCRLWFKFRSEQGDALWIGGEIPVPITPGSYPIRRGGGSDPGVLGAQFMTLRDFAQGTYRLHAQSGTLVIESVNPALIVGRVETRVGTGNIRADVHVEFSLPPILMEGMLGPDAPLHPCVAPVEAADESQSGSTSVPEGGSQQSGSESGQSNENETSDPDGVGDTDDGSESGPEEPAPEEEAREFDGLLQFSQAGETGLHSEPQAVGGARSTEGIVASAPAFSVTFILPFDDVTQCFQQGEQAVLWLLTKARGVGGTYVLDVVDAPMALEVEAGRLRLEMGLDDMDLALLADSAEAVGLTPTQGKVRVDVVGAALQVTAMGSTGTCDDLIDFSLIVEDSAP